MQRGSRHREACIYIHTLAWPSDRPPDLLYLVTASQGVTHTHTITHLALLSTPQILCILSLLLKACHSLLQLLVELVQAVVITFQRFRSHLNRLYLHK
jgi:hypothetical protein